MRVCGWGGGVATMWWIYIRVGTRVGTCGGRVYMWGGVGGWW